MAASEDISWLICESKCMMQIRWKMSFERVHFSVKFSAVSNAGEIMAGRGCWRRNYSWSWVVVGGRGGSWMVARFSNACYLFIILLVTHLSESQQKSNINFRTLYNLHPQDQSWVLVTISNWQCLLQFQSQINFRLPCTSVYGNFIFSISLVQSQQSSVNLVAGWREMVGVWC